MIKINDSDPFGGRPLALFVAWQVVYNAAAFGAAIFFHGVLPTVESSMNKWLLGVFLGLGFAGHGQADAVSERYLRTCAVCHEAGVANAPRTGAPAEWEAPLAKGMDALLQSIEQGLNAMPPKGMCFDCSAAEYQALIEYMAAAR